MALASEWGEDSEGRLQLLPVQVHFRFTFPRASARMGWISATGATAGFARYPAGLVSRHREAG
jgi:hypothetical protein